MHLVIDKFGRVWRSSWCFVVDAQPDLVESKVSTKRSADHQSRSRAHLAVRVLKKFLKNKKLRKSMSGKIGLISTVAFHAETTEVRILT
jgi:hypothetical protein